MAIYKDVSSLEVVGYTEPKNGTFSDGVQFVLEKLDAIPEVDVAPIVHAHYKSLKATECCTLIRWGSWCTHCNEIVPYANFCNNCGAKMDEKEEVENDV